MGQKETRSTQHAEAGKVAEYVYDDEDSHLSNQNYYNKSDSPTCMMRGIGLYPSIYRTHLAKANR